MAKHIIKWTFIDYKTAKKAIELLGAKNLDYISFYKDNKLIDKNSYSWTDAYSADKRAIRELKIFFKENKGIHDFIELNKK